MEHFAGNRAFYSIIMMVAMALCLVILTSNEECHILHCTVCFGVNVYML